MSRSSTKLEAIDARTVTSIDDLPLPSAALLDEIVKDLSLADHMAVSQIKHVLKMHAHSFAVGRFLHSRWPTVHDDARRMRTIRDAIDKIDAALRDLSLYHLLLLDVAFAEKSKGERRLSDIESELASLRELAAGFAEYPFANKQPDHPLTNAVGGLMVYLEELTGNRATVTSRKSDMGTEPELSSPEAVAIGKLLRVAQPDLLTTTLVNTIKTIRRAAGDGALKGFDHQRILGRSVYAQ